MRSDWILFTILGLLWLGAGGIRLRLPGRSARGGAVTPDAPSTPRDELYGK